MSDYDEVIPEVEAWLGSRNIGFRLPDPAARDVVTTVMERFIVGDPAVWSWGLKSIVRRIVCGGPCGHLIGGALSGFSNLVYFIPEIEAREMVVFRAEKAGLTAMLSEGTHYEYYIFSSDLARGVVETDYYELVELCWFGKEDDG